MADNTLNEILVMLQSLWIQASSFLNTLQISDVLEAISTSSMSEIIYLLVLFVLLFFLYKILLWVLGTVYEMIKFGIIIAFPIVLYWIFVSIDVEKGNEELRATRERLVKGAKEFVFDRDL
ncbi:10589_t:CDS:1 [Funneliformis caledonium]|uniref:10589_t:CDS:1 n=1 Tax=Funneliformis caledonium TaxID=1117310 RepID=A0A9N9DTT7_9GLOM|nr:10589_t:CDS:1 [Funneliformis caledonium]